MRVLLLLAPLGAAAQQLRHAPPHAPSWRWAGGGRRGGDPPVAAAARGAPRRLADPTEYDDLAWTDLPAMARAAFETLGYDAEIWESGDDSAAYDTPWADLTNDERNAAEYLGWTEQAWDEALLPTTSKPTKAPTTERPTKAPTPKPTEKPTKKPSPKQVTGTDWDAMKSRQRKALKLFGYTREIWNDGEPIVVSVRWANLSEEEVVGAKTLGYTKKTWDDMVREKELCVSLVDRTCL